MMTRRAAKGLDPAEGMTLIEVVTAMATAGIVIACVYLVLGAALKGYFIVHARVLDQGQGRHALAWIVDRTRQITYDPHAPCPEGLLRIGTGSGFRQRFAFRAILDESLAMPRRTYAYYVDARTLWQETLIQESAAQCADEANRTLPDPGRVSLTPPIVQAFDLAYLDRHGAPTSTPGSVRSIRITLTLGSRSILSRLESQTYQTVVMMRGP